MTGAGVVVAGAGQGGFTVAASLRTGGYAGPVVLVGDEPGLPYQRPPLSKAYLKGDVGLDLVALRPEAFYAKQRVELVTGDRVEGIDRAAGRALLASGRSLPYDHLVLAVGAHARPLPVPGADLDGVHHLHTLADADALRPRVERARSVVVVGGGFIGLEFAAVARALGADGTEVTVVEAMGRTMSRVVSEEISRAFEDEHARRGVRVLLGTGVSALVGDAAGRVTAVETSDGSRLSADLVVVGIGVVPNTELAEHCGLAVDNGVVVDEQLRTGDPAISAIGDCASYPSRATRSRLRLESVQNAVDHAKCVAARLTGGPAAYGAVPWFWSDQYSLKLQIAGITTGHDAAVVRGDPASGSFSVMCFLAGGLVGVESVNRTADHLAARKLLALGGELTPDQAADPGLDLKAHVAAQVAASAGSRAAASVAATAAAPVAATDPARG